MSYGFRGAKQGGDAIGQVAGTEGEPRRSIGSWCGGVKVGR